MKYLLSLIIAISTFSLWAGQELPGLKALEGLPVQDGGRIKPFKSFADESLQLIYGKTSFNHRPATEIVMTWMLIPNYWKNINFIQIRHHGVREALKLEKPEEVYRNLEELMSNQRLNLLFQDLDAQQKASKKLNPYYQAIQTLRAQLSTFHGIRMGDLLHVAPRPPAESNSTWYNINELPTDLGAKFYSITKAFSQSISKIMEKADDSVQKPTDSVASLNDSVGEFIQEAKKINPKAYANFKKINWELNLARQRPFLWSWIFYLISVIFSFSYIFSKKKRFKKWSLLFVFAGLCFHTYGISLRVLVTGRPPVSNMYETILWVPWVVIVLSLIFDKVLKSPLLILGSGILATLCLILSDLSPVVLDPKLQPLQAVLDDSFWLMTHVLIIVSSYGAFALAFILGDILLVYYLKDEQKYAPDIKDGVKAIYKALQVGVVLLALGTILGGVWADYSWGRFWGWDPKENWALITLLGYLAVLHGRIMGWVREFSMAVLAVCTFSLVIMAWYGVNFVLGAGLHTYGFGAGGVEYVTGAVALQMLFVIYVAAVRRSRQSSSKLDS